MDWTKATLGIELGSTRIKAVLLDENHMPAADGSHEWENRLENGIWTYSMDDIHEGIRACYRDLRENVKKKFGEDLTSVGAIGVSGMMHGYLPFDSEGRQLAEFRTWRNTNTGEAAGKLTELLGFNIPQRWSIAHLYQAILNGEEHVSNIARLTTLAGYIHMRLTGEHVMGIGEASGMFPIDSGALDYDVGMMDKFDELIRPYGYKWQLRDILPAVKTAGEAAGTLTEDGARFLDPEGSLRAGIPVCPCEGDAGTGMTATNSVRVRTGNISAGTSDFVMVVTDHPLGVHTEIDMVTTPAGHPVAMVHCNNCTSDINAWVRLFGEVLDLAGCSIDRGELFTRLFLRATEGAPDGGGLLSYNYLSGEGVTAIDAGRPVFARQPDAEMSLANFMRTHLMSAMATLKIGLDILKDEDVDIDCIQAHGGFFKTPGAGDRIVSAAAAAPVASMRTAGEGGPYGMALLAAYMLRREEGETLEDYLDNRVFSGAEVTTVMADEEEIAGFARFIEVYKKAFGIERLAVEVM